MQSIRIHDAARRWSLGIALLAALAALLVSLAPTTNAQQPPTPHWFWGNDADAYAGSEIQVFNQDGDQISAGGDDAGKIGDDGDWHAQINPNDATQVKLRIISDLGDRETDLIDVITGGFDPNGLSITAFSNIIDAADDDDDEPIIEEPGPTTITVRIIARRAADGRVEFGMRGPDGEDILPPRRYFPVGGPGHSRWLRSTVIEFGDGFEGRIIARYVEADGRTEFGFRVEGHEDILPPRRYFPAEGPDHNRFLRSTEITLPLPR